MSHAGQLLLRLAISLAVGLLAFLMAFTSIWFVAGKELGSRLPDDQLAPIAFADALDGGFAAGLLITFFVFLILTVRADRTNGAGSPPRL